MLLQTREVLGYLKVGCSSSSDNKDEVSETKIEETNFTPVEFTYSDGAKEYDVKVEKPREKAVTLSQFMTEMLLTLYFS